MTVSEPTADGIVVRRERKENGHGSIHADELSIGKWNERDGLQWFDDVTAVCEEVVQGVVDATQPGVQLLDVAIWNILQYYINNWFEHDMIR